MCCLLSSTRPLRCAGNCSSAATACSPKEARRGPRGCCSRSVTVHLDDGSEITVNVRELKAGRDDALPGAAPPPEQPLRPPPAGRHPRHPAPPERLGGRSLRPTPWIAGQARLPPARRLRRRRRLREETTATERTGTAEKRARGRARLRREEALLAQARRQGQVSLQRQARRPRRRPQRRREDLNDANLRVRVRLLRGRRPAREPISQSIRPAPVRANDRVLMIRRRLPTRELRRRAAPPHRHMRGAANAAATAADARGTRAEEHMATEEQRDGTIFTTTPIYYVNDKPHRHT